MKAKYFIFPILTFLVASFYSAALVGETQKSGPGSGQDHGSATVADDEVLGFLPDVIAKIGDKTLTKADLQEQIKNMPIPSGQKLPEEVMKKIAKDLATSLVDKNLLLEIAKSDGITPSVEMATEALEVRMAEMPERMLEMTKQQALAQGMTMAQYKEKVVNDPQSREDLAIDSWIRAKIVPEVTVTEEDVAAFYEQHQDQFKKPETVTASHILIIPEDDTDDAKQAAEKKTAAILARLKKGENFGELAESESACPSGKASKGSLGEFPRGSMTPKFEEVAFALKPGQLSEVVETQYGYHVIKVEGRSDVRTLPLDEVSGYISANLKNIKIKERIDEVLTKEKKRLDVKILI